MCEFSSDRHRCHKSIDRVRATKEVPQMRHLILNVVFINFGLVPLIATGLLWWRGRVNAAYSKYAPSNVLYISKRDIAPQSGCAGFPCAVLGRIGAFTRGRTPAPSVVAGRRRFPSSDDLPLPGFSAVAISC